MDQQRRKMFFWQPFNQWWRDLHKQLDRRPRLPELRSWYQENAHLVWGDEAPTFEEARNHAKGMRLEENIQPFFEAYRKRKKEKQRKAQGVHATAAASRRLTKLHGNRAGPNKRHPSKKAGKKAVTGGAEHVPSHRSKLTSKSPAKPVHTYGSDSSSETEKSSSSHSTADNMEPHLAHQQNTIQIAAILPSLSDAPQAGMALFTHSRLRQPPISSMPLDLPPLSETPSKLLSRRRARAQSTAAVSLPTEALSANEHIHFPPTTGPPASLPHPKPLHIPRLDLDLIGRTTFKWDLKDSNGNTVLSPTIISPNLFSPGALSPFLLDLAEGHANGFTFDVAMSTPTITIPSPHSSAFTPVLPTRSLDAPARSGGTANLNSEGPSSQLATSEPSLAIQDIKGDGTAPRLVGEDTKGGSKAPAAKRSRAVAANNRSPHKSEQGEETSGSDAHAQAQPSGGAQQHPYMEGPEIKRLAPGAPQGFQHPGMQVDYPERQWQLQVAGRLGPAVLRPQLVYESVPHPPVYYTRISDPSIQAWDQHEGFHPAAQHPLLLQRHQISGHEFGAVGRQFPNHRQSAPNLRFPSDDALLAHPVATKARPLTNPPGSPPATSRSQHSPLQTQDVPQPNSAPCGPTGPFHADSLFLTAPHLRFSSQTDGQNVSQQTDGSWHSPERDPSMSPWYPLPPNGQAGGHLYPGTLMQSEEQLLAAELAQRARLSSLAHPNGYPDVGITHPGSMDAERAELLWRTSQLAPFQQPYGFPATERTTRREQRITAHEEMLGLRPSSPALNYELLPS